MEKTDVVIVDYGMGNLASIKKMVEFVGGQAIISADSDVIKLAKKIILPGVGSFDFGMQNLKSCGLIPVLEKKALHEKVPFLGICLGAQILTRKSEEGSLAGLSWLEADTIRFRFGDRVTPEKIPHMGWNTVNLQGYHPLFSEFNETPRFYFAHSYHIRCDHKESILATTLYGYEFASIVQKDNLVGVQFHPEKSHLFGKHFFKKFISI